MLTLSLMESNSCAFPSAAAKMVDQASHEKSPTFEIGQRVRAGFAERIPVLFRGCGMKRCLAKGRERFELLVGAAVLANNPMVIASFLIEKQRHGCRGAA